MADFPNNNPPDNNSPCFLKTNARLKPINSVVDDVAKNLAKVNLVEKGLMRQTLATITLDTAPQGDLHPLLLEHIPETQIAHFGLLNGLSAAEIKQRYAPVAGEKVTMTHTEGGSFIALSAARVSEALQVIIKQLEGKGFSTILVLCAGEYKNLVADSAVLLEPYSILPPLVNAIANGYQVGVIVARAEYINEQTYKWRSLQWTPHFAVASPWEMGNDRLIEAALTLQDRGADILLLDCLGYYQRHRDFLEKLLGIPVLLSNTLIARLAAELLV
ncbi:AroM family protein [Erwinia tracheiphila]|uniref:AroM protein n=1 Tax=Erwinia tracheiphila TaxID=65700 RepID=A0A345CYV1_9GAMM|nr:AroM family protein [Erwinia tracheiphila]AXF78618.1 hypothetical protein AV903_25690 [Erwinia tracheiphila]UIA82643.1 AroM family protein [Erwinia tracheiphila]UIA91233.1 AroM family protein [Erwinia tracheiphila]